MGFLHLFLPTSPTQSLACHYKLLAIQKMVPEKMGPPGMMDV